MSNQEYLKYLEDSILNIQKLDYLKLSKAHGIINELYRVFTLQCFDLKTNAKAWFTYDFNKFQSSIQSVAYDFEVCSLVAITVKYITMFKEYAESDKHGKYIEYIESALSKGEMNELQLYPYLYIMNKADSSSFDFSQAKAIEYIISNFEEVFNNQDSFGKMFVNEIVFVHFLEYLIVSMNDQQLLTKLILLRISICLIVFYTFSNYFENEMGYSQTSAIYIKVILKFLRFFIGQIDTVIDDVNYSRKVDTNIKVELNKITAILLCACFSQNSLSMGAHFKTQILCAHLLLKIYLKVIYCDETQIEANIMFNLTTSSFFNNVVDKALIEKLISEFKLAKNKVNNLVLLLRYLEKKFRQKRAISVSSIYTNLLGISPKALEIFNLVNHSKMSKPEIEIYNSKLEVLKNDISKSVITSLNITDFLVCMMYLQEKAYDQFEINNSKASINEMVQRFYFIYPDQVYKNICEALYTVYDKVNLHSVIEKTLISFISEDPFNKSLLFHYLKLNYNLGNINKCKQILKNIMANDDETMNLIDPSLPSLDSQSNVKKDFSAKEQKSSDLIDLKPLNHIQLIYNSECLSLSFLIMITICINDEDYNKALELSMINIERLKYSSKLSLIFKSRNLALIKRSYYLLGISYSKVGESSMNQKYREYLMNLSLACLENCFSEYFKNIIHTIAQVSDELEKESEFIEEITSVYFITYVRQHYELRLYSKALSLIQLLTPIILKFIELKDYSINPLSYDLSHFFCLKSICYLSLKIYDKALEIANQGLNHSLLKIFSKKGLYTLLKIKNLILIKSSTGLILQNSLENEDNIVKQQRDIKINGLVEKIIGVIDSVLDDLTKAKDLCETKLLSIKGNPDSIFKDKYVIDNLEFLTEKNAMLKINQVGLITGKLTASYNEIEASRVQLLKDFSLINNYEIFLIPEAFEAIPTDSLGKPENLFVEKINQYLINRYDSMNLKTNYESPEFLLLVII